MTKKTKLIITAVFIAIIGLWQGYVHLISNTRIAFVNYPEYMMAPLLDQQINPSIDIELLNWKEETKVASLKKYDMIIFFGMGLNFTEEQTVDIEKLNRKVYTTASTRSETALSALEPEHLEKLKLYLGNMDEKNFTRMLNFIRVEVDGKILFGASVEEPIKLERKGFMHPVGTDKKFPTFEAYMTWYKTTEYYSEDKPMVILLGGNSTTGFKDLIAMLESKDINVVLPAGMGSFLKYAKTVNPDGVIYFPHGRLASGSDAEETLAYLKEKSIPLFCPIKTSQPYEVFLKDQRGMTGGMLSQSVVMAEFDGGVAPTALFALFKNTRGLNEFRLIKDQADQYTSMIKKTLALKTKPNKDKRIAIIFYKGAGKNSMEGGGLEVSDSIFNTLKNLEQAGYTTGELPESAEELNQMVQENVSTFASYATGAEDEFLAKASLVTITREEFNTWATKAMPKDLVQELVQEQGEFPQEMKLGALRFGNILMMVQGAAGVGESETAVTHGVKQNPPYSYMTTYFYCEHGFKADALMHFGTHGSMEFTPWKQVALSSYDWPDILIGSMPHYYLYVINNVGEALIAKRRSYATMLSHLTAPFMHAETQGPMAELDKSVHLYESAEGEALKRKYLETIVKSVLELNIHKDLDFGDDFNIDSINEEVFDRLHNYVEEVKFSKVNRGMYIIGRPYSDEEAEETASLMTLDRIANELFDADVKAKQVDQNFRKNYSDFIHRYNGPAQQIIENAFAKEQNRAAEQVGACAEGCTHVHAHVQTEAKPEPELTSTPRPEAKPDEISVAMLDAMPPAMREALAARDKAEADAKAKADALAKQDPQERLEAFALQSKEDLLSSTVIELREMLVAFNGGYLSPSFGGDLINSVDSIPTGRNLIGINPDRLPTKESYAVGKELAESLIAIHLKNTGEYPKKVAFSLWGGEFLRTQGTNIGEIFFLLGVEPIWNSRGSVGDVSLIPMSELKRPRIDVVVQTSGQFRGAATGRMRLIDKAVRLAAEDPSTDYSNFVRENSLIIVQKLIERGMAPKDAKTYSNARLFGGLNGGFGTGIMGMVESGSSWDDTTSIADTYINNMGALYTDDKWGVHVEGMFAAALENTDIIVQSRSSNSWGPLSLDHVYEFTGGISLAVKRVTGKDATAYFNDLRTASRPKVQEVGEAAMIEARSTLLNPKYLEEMLQEGANAAGSFAEAFRNTYGWEVTRPDMLEDHLWESYKDVYIDDSLELGMREFFDEKNPYALQEMTGVMLETIRKGYWDADEATIIELSNLHIELVEKFDPGCSGFVCGNPKLREMILNKTTLPKEAYNTKIEQVLKPRQAPKSEEKTDEVTGQTLKEQDVKQNEPQEEQDPSTLARRSAVIFGVIVLFIIVKTLLRRKRD